MKRAPVIACCGLMLLAGLGSAGAVEGARPVSVRIDVTTTRGGDLQLCRRGQVSTKARPCETGTGPQLIGRETTTTKSYSLTCYPTGGTLPLAGRVCAYIASYQKGMLNPSAAPPDARKFICSGFMGTTVVFTVTAAVGGTTTSFSGQPFGCSSFDPDPTRVALEVYALAIRRDEARLAALEPALRCGEDSTFICSGRDLRDATWEAVRVAETHPPLSRIDAAALFRERTGSRRCSIPVGARSTTTTKTLDGRCTVTVFGLAKISSKPTVRFTLQWPTSNSSTTSHTWLVLLDGYASTSKVVSVNESGSVPPQRWR